MQIKTVIVGVALFLGACGSTAATTTFVSSWKSPTAQPLQVKGSRVAASVMLNDVASRRDAEDKLAKQITERGGQGVPMYQIVQNEYDEATARDALAKAQVQGVVVMQPSEVDLTTNTPIDYSASPYNTYWGGYYDFGQPVAAPTKSVSVNTLIYSLRQNQLVWAGQSKTSDATTVDSLISEVSAATADELNRLALLTP
jgi:hypothetical protein